MRAKLRNNDEVCHIWASQSQDRGRAGNIFFEGDTIFSYGYHFPMARIVKIPTSTLARVRDKRVVVLVNPARYSSTTSQHQRSVTGAISHLESIYVPHLWPELSGSKKRRVNGSDTRKGHKTNLDYFRAKIDKNLLKLASARKYQAQYLEAIRGLVRAGNRYCVLFNLKTRFELPKDFEEKAQELLAEDRRRRLKNAKIEAARQEARHKELQVRHAKYLERLALWKQNKLTTQELGYDPLPSENENFDEVRLAKGRKIVETARGAFVRVKDALRLVKVIRGSFSAFRNRPLKKRIMVGVYPLNEVGPDYIKIGCHRFRRQDLVKIADTLKL